MGRPLTDPVIAFESQAAWEAWLAEHHATSNAVWVKMAKKASGIPSVTFAEALESALCYGWIDGQRNRFDDQWFIQRFTPRRSRSKWSKINRSKAEQLISEGRMRPAGLREVERAQADGRWDAAHDAPSAATVPPDIQQALDEHPAAAAFFATLNRQNRLLVILPSPGRQEAGDSRPAHREVRRHARRGDQAVSLAAPSSPPLCVRCGRR